METSRFYAIHNNIRISLGPVQIQSKINGESDAVISSTGGIIRFLFQSPMSLSLQSHEQQRTDQSDYIAKLFITFTFNFDWTRLISNLAIGNFIAKHHKEAANVWSLISQKNPLLPNPNP